MSSVLGTSRRRAYLKKDDIEEGIKKQRMIGQVVSKILGFDLLETADIHHYGKLFYYDWCNEEETIFGELKYRRNMYHNKYTTTIVGKHKIDYAKSNPDKKFFIVFRFDDGLYYVKVDELPIDTMKTRWNYAHSGYKEEVYDIPIEYLKCIDELAYGDEA